MENKKNVRPEAVHTPLGFQRIKKGERLKYGDLFMNPISLQWEDVHVGLITNQYSNCIRPIHQATIPFPYEDRS